MLFNDLEDIKFGELVIFDDIDQAQLDELTDVLIDADIDLSVRAEQSYIPELHGLAVARRPLVLNPDRLAFVASHVEALDFNAKAMYKRIENCMDDNVPSFELLPNPYFIKECIDIDIDESEVSCSIMSECESECASDDLVMPSMPSIANNVAPKPRNPIDAEEDEIDSGLKFDRKKWMDKLSALVLEYVTANHAMPPQEIINSVIVGKLQISDDNVLSPIVVNGDMHIILPAYNELELRMTPLARTVYILFLCHPEGIVLKNINDYREQLRDIYLMVKPGADWRLADEYINELTYPGSDSLQQKLSLIKRSINRYLLRKNIAQAYHITGQRGKPYKIAGIAPDQITLPRALRP